MYRQHLLNLLRWVHWVFISSFISSFTGSLLVFISLLLLRMLPLKTYLINLDKDSDRLDYVIPECNRNGIDPIRVSGVLGSKLTADELKQYTTPFCELFCIKSTIGCALSHIKCWNKIIDDNEPEVMIIEDDVQFEHNFMKLFIEKYQDLPSSYDICFIGHCGLKYGTVISDNIYVPKDIACMHCYIVSNKGAKKLLDLFSKVNGHIDLDMNNNRENFEAYAFSPDLVYQKIDYRRNSNNANIKFPKLINYYLKDIIDDNNRVPLDYALVMGLYQIYGYVLNKWTIIFFIFGIILGLVPFIIFIFLSIVILLFLVKELKLDMGSYVDIIGSIIIIFFGFLIGLLLKFLFMKTLNYVKLN